MLHATQSVACCLPAANPAAPPVLSDAVRSGAAGSIAESFGGEAFTDHPSLAGRVLEEETIGTVDGVAGQVASSMLYEYERRITHDLGEGASRHPEWAAVTKTTESVAAAPGEFRQRSTEATYDDRYQLASTLETGWSDEDVLEQRCHVNDYAENEAAWMFTYPVSITTVEGACDSTEVLTEEEIYYDGSNTLGELTGPGRPTRERVRLDGDTWTETTTAYDDFGRVTAVTDAEGATTTTGYEASPANAIPTRTIVTDPAGNTSSTDWLVEHGVPVREEDANGNLSVSHYDSFGRLLHAFAPTEEGATWPTWTFRYRPSAGDRSVQASQLTGGDPFTGQGLQYEPSWVLYDGFWRERQTQTRSPRDGHLILDETSYDGRGMVRDETASQAAAGTGGDLVTGVAWANRTRSLYDDLGRPSRVEWWRGGDVARESTLDYSYDTVTVTDAEGNRSRERTDVWGRVVEAAEHDGTDWVSSNYSFDMADRLVSVADAEGNETGYTYNMAGWRLSEDDPNRGTASYSYDMVGRVTATVDGEGNEIHTAYDELGRPSERRDGSTAGELLASWAYDGAPGGVGLPESQTRHTADGDWITAVTGYDALGRPEGSSLTVPANVEGLAGTYAVSQDYDVAGRVSDVHYPEVGGLPAETVTTSYGQTGLPTQMTGLDDYATVSWYDDRGRPVYREIGGTGGGAPLLRGWTYNEDQQLASSSTAMQTATGAVTVSSYELGYDNVGNPVDKGVTRQDGAWRECYNHDARYRLVEAFTVDHSSDCASGVPGSGDKPFEHSYEYSPDGNLLERTEDGETTGYSYPAAGEQRPHAPSSVGDDSYSWDGNGNLAERTVDGDTETFNWDSEGHLAAVDGSEATTGFVYDPSGQRLARTTGETTTVYVAGHEVTVDATGDVVDAVRPYSFGGEMIATRSVSQGVQYLATDETGSVEVAVDGDDPASPGVDAARTYDPYGNVRAEDGDGEIATERGFLGQVEDPTTDLSYLNARYYDTSIGVFISTDPVYDTGRTKTLNPYSYGANNPDELL